MSGGGAEWRPRTLELPIRPGTTVPAQCPWGCRLVIGGMTRSWCQDYQSAEFLCLACRALNPEAGRWVQIDPAVQVPEDRVDPTRLQLAVTPPAVRYGVGAIRLRLGSTIFGYVELTLCEVDRRAVLLGLEVEPAHRRRGAGRVLVAAAVARAAGYDWSTVPVGTDPVAVAFAARTRLPGPAPPYACSHQVAAGAVSERARWTRWW